ncbi:hypothetical protein OGAPHI_002382 [Ogataea philodendri]|uniref:Protein DML1 n=1 Tax=Ogataea philodendri TaxID=1378263 RepID=A0A9P8T700_9ASCO|nr:uncharacterized protein OGAPHI_002382 [Ogataea philodendri]KAH3668628.1 hypothetical protein OGAPHI_002382 [Ogataea philodendri]
MHEIVTVSVGPHPNNIVTHFNNVQEDKLYLAPRLADNPTDPAVHMEPVRQGTSFSFYPRSVLWEYENGYGALQKHTSLNIDPTGYEVIAKPKVARNRYQDLLDDAQPTNNVLHQDSVRYWSDFSRVLYKPESLLNVSNWQYDYKNQTGFLKMHPERHFEGYDVGAAEYGNKETDFVDTTFRYALEKCDLVSGLNLVTEIDTAWGGFSDQLLLDIRDEYAKTPVSTWGLVKDDARLNFPLLLSRIRAIVGLVQNSSLFFPLNSAPELPQWVDKESLWEVSAFQSIPFEFVNGLFSTKKPFQMSDFVNGLTLAGGQNIVSDLTCTPHVFNCVRMYGNDARTRHHFALSVINKGSTKVEFTHLVEAGTSSKHCIEYKSDIPFNSALDSFPAQFREDTPTLCSVGVTNSPRKWFQEMAGVVSKYYRGDDRQDLKNDMETISEQYVWGYESDDEDLSNQSSHSSRDAHGDVTGSPDQVGESTTGGGGGESTPHQVGNGLLSTHVRKGTKVVVFERLDVSQGSVQSGLDLGFFVRVGRSDQFSLQVVNGSSLGESRSKVVSLLVSNLTGWWVAGEGTVTNSVNVLSTLDLEVLIHKKTSSSTGLTLNLLEKTGGEVSRTDTTGPDKHTVWKLLLLGASVLLLGGSGDDSVGNVVNGSVDEQLDVVLSKSLLSVSPQALGERVQNVWQSLDQSDLDFLGDFRHPFAQVLVNVVLQFTGKFDTSWTTTNNNKVQQSLSLGTSFREQRSLLDRLQDLSSDLDGVWQLLQETSIVGNTWDVESGWLSSNSNNQVVVLNFLLNSRRVWELDLQRVVGVVQVSSVGFVVGNFGRSSLGNRSDWLNNRSWLDGSGRGRWQQRSEQEVASWRNDGDLVKAGVEVLQHGCSTPTTSENNQVLLLNTGSGQVSLWLLALWVGLSVDGETKPGSCQNGTDGTHIEWDLEELVEQGFPLSRGNNNRRAESSGGGEIKANGPSSCQHSG